MLSRHAVEELIPYRSTEKTPYLTRYIPTLHPDVMDGRWQMDGWLSRYGTYHAPYDPMTPHSVCVLASVWCGPARGICKCGPVYRPLAVGTWLSRTSFRPRFDPAAL